MKKIIIIGAGLHAEVVKNIISYDLNNSFIGYLDDNKTGNEIIGKIDAFIKYIDDAYFICGIGDNDIREDIFNRIKSRGGKFINAIHPKAYIEKGVILGEGIVIGANSYINIGTKIGDNTIINNGVIIEHHNNIGNHCHLAPGVITGGSVKIGNNVFLGINTLVNDEITIEENIYAGSGTVINRNVDKDNLIVGVPYRIIKKIGK